MADTDVDKIANILTKTTELMQKIEERLQVVEDKIEEMTLVDYATDKIR